MTLTTLLASFLTTTN